MKLEQKLKLAAQFEQPDPEMMEALITRMEEVEAKRRPFRLKSVLIATVLLLALVGTAYAIGWIPAWTGRFAGIFGERDGQKKLIEEMGVPLGVSSTADGITITAESMLNDGRTMVVLLSAKREDGAPLVPEDAEGFEHLIFGDGPNSETPEVYRAQRAKEPITYFAEYHPGEEEAYCFAYFETAGSLPQEITLSMRELEAWYTDHTEPIADYTWIPWKLKIPVQGAKEAQKIAGGETIEAGGETYQLEGLYVSPISVMADYTVLSARPSARRTVVKKNEDGTEAEVTWHEMEYGLPLRLKVRLKDGQTIDLSTITDNNGITNLMGRIQVDETLDQYKITQGGVLQEIIPLEDIDCIIVCGHEYPVS